MNFIKVRNLEIGTGVPKICVPIVGTTKQEIIESAEQAAESSADMVEWRGDWFEDILDFDKTEELLTILRRMLNDMPVLFTFRTSKEGGEKSIDPDTYVRLNQKVIRTGLADIVDVEIFTGKESVEKLIYDAHAHEVKVIVSNHDFLKTPSKEELVSRLCNMAETGADIAKIAVMPRNGEDVLTLLSATEKVKCMELPCPIITMSMSGIGTISRVSGEVFGSAVTFGALGKASAPGQMEVAKLRTVLSLLHECL